MARLAQTVILWDEKAQKPIVLEAGTEPDEWAADQITNPKAWAPEGESTPEGNGDQGSDGQDANGGGENADDAPPEPPREGKGSGVGAWRDYAKAIGVEFDKDAKREDIWAAVDAAKADTELEEPSRDEPDLEAWQEYAEAKGFDVPDDATVEDIIAAIDADGDES